MIQAISLARVIEELAYTEAPARNAVGAFQSTEQLLGSSAHLEAAFSGLFGFIAFHAKHDSSVREYIEGGSVCEDAGKNIMVLILSSDPCAFAKDLKPAMLIGDIRVSYPSHPAYELVNSVFPAEPRPALPGLLLFDKLSGVGSAVYVSLSDCETSKEVGDLCREVFTLAENAFVRGGSSGWIDRISAKLESKGIVHKRTGHMGLREWLAIALNHAKILGTTLVALVPKVASKLMGL